MVQIFVDDDFQHYVSKDLIYRIVLSSPFHQLVFDSVSIYCVDSKVLDNICPPERVKGIPRGNLRDVKDKLEECLDRIEEASKESKPIEEISEIVDRCIDDISESERVIVAKACYVNLGGDICVFLREKFGIDASAGPGIFVAVNRALHNAELISSQIGHHKYRAIFLNVFRSLLIHETFHAFTDLNGLKYCDEVWFRFFEESLAEYTAYLHLSNFGRIVFGIESREKPIEYKAWVVWRKLLSTFDTFMCACISWLKNWPIQFLNIITSPHPILGLGKHGNIKRKTQKDRHIFDISISPFVLLQKDDLTSLSAIWYIAGSIIKGLNVRALGGIIENIKNGKIGGEYLWKYLFLCLLKYTSILTK